MVKSHFLRKENKKTRGFKARSKTIWVAVALFLSLFLVGNVSAILQTISYSQDKTRVEIKDFMGLGTTIATIKLNSPLVNNFIEVGKDRVVFSFEVDTQWDSFKDAISNSVKIFDLNKGGKEVNYKTYKWVYAVYGYINVPVWFSNCKDDPNNKSKGQICVSGYNLEKQYTIIKWKELTSFDFIKGKVTIGLMTDVNVGDYYDGIPELFGKEFTEWLTWDPIVVDATGGSMTFMGSGTYWGMGIRTKCNLRILNFGIDYHSGMTGSCGIGHNISADDSDAIVVDATGTLRKARDCNFAVPLEVLNNTPVWLYTYAGTGPASEGGAFAKIYGINVDFELPCVEPALGLGCSNNPGNLAGYKVNEVVNVTTQCETSNGTFPYDYAPVIYMMSPENNTLLNTGEVTLECNATDDYGVTEVSIWETGELSDLDFTTLSKTNSTTNTTSYENLTATNYTADRLEGWYGWACGAEDSINAPVVPTKANRTFMIDHTKPTIIIDYPVNLFQFVTQLATVNISLNATINDSYGGFTTIPTLSSCWITNSTTNATYTCNNNASGVFYSGWNTIDFYANDSVGNERKESTIFLINTYFYTKSAVPTIIEKGNTTIYFNLTANSITTTTANLTYNNTLYVMSAGTNNGTFVKFSANITAPEVTKNTNITYRIDYVLDGTAGTTADYGMFIYDFVGLNATGFYCNNASYNFTLVDEANFSHLYGEFEYNFLYDVGGSEYRTYGKANSTNLYVCVNKSISPTWIIKEGEIHYRADNYVDRRYYIFDNTVIANKITNITLYDLLSADQTSFKLTVTDNSLNPYSNKFTTLVRWYPDLNQYNIVDMGKTDEKGETIIHVRTEDVDYRIGLYDRDGTLIKLANPVRMVCITTPCEYTLRVSPAGIDYFNFLNIQYIFDYDSTSHIWSFVWSDSSGTTDEMNMTIYKMTGTEVYPVCENTLTAVSGALSCNTTLFTGTLKGVVTRTASPPVTIASKIITTTVTAFKSKFGLFLTFIIAVPIIFIFALVSPIGAVIGGIVALIPALYFGAISWVVLAGLAVLGGIVIHFLKRIG